MGGDQSSEEMRLLCEEMLAGLGKWLRAAGYDTAIAESGIDDAALFAMAVREHRLLLTCDRQLMQRKGAETVAFLLEGDDPNAWAQTLRQELGIDWCLAPFSRCLQCNAPLEPGAGGYVDQLPRYVVDEHHPRFHCPACAKAYWQGGHVERMFRELERWQGKR